MKTATRVAMFAITGATALSVAACGNSHTAQPAQPASPTNSTTAQAQPPTQSPSQQPGPSGGARVSGLIASVAGDNIQVTQGSGTATVGFTSSTKISEFTPATLKDVSAGSCVTIKPTKDSQQGGTVTAQRVRISDAVDGKCQEPTQPPAGRTPPPGAPEHGGPHVAGTVASVAGDTITVNGDQNGNPTAVTVTDTTKYGKDATANAQAITAGKCISAQGTQATGGALQATAINVRAAHDGNCSAGGPQHGGHGHGHGG